MYNLIQYRKERIEDIKKEMIDLFSSDSFKLLRRSFNENMKNKHVEMLLRINESLDMTNQELNKLK